MAHIELHGRRIRYLLFDLGETLWIHQDTQIIEEIVHRQNRVAAELLQMYCALSSCPLTDYMHLSVQLRTAIVHRSLYWRRQYYDCEPDPYRVTMEACQQLHLPLFDRERIFTLYEAFRSPLALTRRLFDDVLEILRALQAQGILLGCVTDRQYGGAAFLTDLKALGLLDYFVPEAIIVSADCGKRKPHPLLFLQAMKALHAAPEETAMVGDFLCRDIAGAKRLNIAAIWKPKERLLRELQKEDKQGVQHPENEALLLYAQHQEEAMYPEMPFDELRPYMKPDFTIEHARKLLSLCRSDE